MNVSLFCVLYLFIISINLFQVTITKVNVDGVVRTKDDFVSGIIEDAGILKAKTIEEVCNVQYTLQHTLYLYIASIYNTTQCNAIQYSTVQYSTVQYSTVQFATIATLNTEIILIACFHILYSIFTQLTYTIQYILLTLYSMSQHTIYR